MFFFKLSFILATLSKLITFLPCLLSHIGKYFFFKAFMMKCFKSTNAKIIVYFWVLEGCARLCYGCQGQWFERGTKCIMHTSIWHSPMRSAKMKLPNISDCSIHQKLLGQAFIQVFTLRCHFQKVRKGYFFLCGCVSVSFFFPQ